MALADVKEPDLGTGKSPDVDKDDALDQQGAATLNGKETSDLDQIGAGLGDDSSNKGGIGTQIGKAGKGVAKFAVNNKKPLIGGGGTIAIVLLLIGGLSLGPLELLHIFENELRHVRAELNKEIDKEATKAEDKLIQRAADKAAAKDGKPAPPGDNISNEDAGGPLASEADSIDYANPTLNEELSSDGVHLSTDADGDVTGVEDSNTGKNLNETELADGDLDTSADSSIGEDLATGTNITGVDELTTEIKLMATEDGVSFSVLPTEDTSGETPAEELDESEDSAVTKGASPEEISGIAQDGIDDTPPSAAQGQSAPPTQAVQEYDNAKSLSGPLEDAEKTADNDFNPAKGVTSSDAIQAGVKEFENSEEHNPEDEASPLGIADTACLVEEGVKDTAGGHKFAVEQLLIRHGYMILTMANQMMEGKLTAKGFGALMSFLQGDPTATPTKAEAKVHATPEASLPFSDSAGWKQATGEPVSSSNPGLDDIDNPLKDPKTVLLTDTANVLGHANPECKLLTGTAGTVAQVGLSGAEIALNGIDGESLEGAQIAATTTAQVGFITLVLPKILAYLTNLGITGTEDAVQWFNISDIGLQLGTAQYAAADGGEPMTSSQDTTAYIQTQQQINQTEAAKPLATQLFAFSDPYSFASKLLLELPLNLRAEVGSMMMSVIDAPETIFNNLTPFVHADASTDANPYGIVQYGFPDEDQFDPDPFHNEAVLRSYSVNVGGTNIPLLTAFGNPVTYNAATGDSSTTDLLHCFVGNSGIPTGGNLDSKDCGDYGELEPSGSSLPASFTPPNLGQIVCNYASSQNINGCDVDTINNEIPSDTLMRYRQYILDSHIIGDIAAEASND